MIDKKAYSFEERKMKDEDKTKEQLIRELRKLRTQVTHRNHLEQQLFKAQKMEAIGKLAGGIAHYFNNILTAIIGYGTFLEMELDKNDKRWNYVSKILTSSYRAADLVQSLLAYSKQQLINPKPIDLNDVVRRVEKLLTGIIGEDIELKTELAKSDLIIVVDRGRIEQVLMNLATNARDAMPDGGKLIIKTEVRAIDDAYIRSHGFGEKGEYAFLSFIDTGTGMDEKTLERVFDPFFTTKAVGKGTGLGLSTVYGIIKQHDGFINVESEAGEGTTVKLYFPISKADREEAQSKAEGGEQNDRVTILVAEDYEFVRELDRSVLEEAGYEVIEAKDGMDAVEKFMENRDKVKFLLLDVVMPKKSGREVYEEIRRVKPDIKVLFISGHSQEIVRKKGIFTEQGVNLVSKPVSPRELLVKVREILDS